MLLRRALVRAAPLGLGLVLAACHASHPSARAQVTSAEPDAGRPRLASAAKSSAGSPASDSGPADAGEKLPPRGAFIGAEACADCHGDEYDAYERDWHSHASRRAGPKAVFSRYDGTHFHDAETEAWMFASDGGYFMRTAGRDGEVATYPVDYVIGGKRMQDSVTVLPDGRWQVLPVYFHVTGKGAWTDYNGAKQGKVGPDDPFFWTNFRRTVNHECVDCHITDPKVRYDAKTHRWSTKMRDVGIGCESCHGPGARHAETQLDSDIIRPTKLDPARELAVCGQCHGPREPLFPIHDQKHHYRPGDRYADFFQPLELVLGSGRSGDFFADGRPKSSSYELQALLQSRCWSKGHATCLSCHTAPHQPHGFDEIRKTVGQSKRRAKTVSDATCEGCHRAIFGKGRAHTHHPKSVTCISCHMPNTVRAVFDRFADHAIDIPNPVTTREHGVPNACNTCHRKRSPKALEKEMLRFWPDVRTRWARRIRLADAFDEATAKKSEPYLKAVIADETEVPLLRGAAAKLLAQRYPNDTKLLVPLLRSKSELLRTATATALGWAKRDVKVASALAPLLKDASLEVRQAAALTLARWGDRRGEAAVWKLAHDPESDALPDPHLMLGMLDLRHGDSSGAASELKRALDLQPYLTPALWLLAGISARKGDVADERAKLEEILRFRPDDRHARARLAALERTPTAAGN